ncbi:excalibur calcium-binding domain-containing protein [Ornithinimicrobium murale]|uniref:excalibur calcium-binding domain-containing protein n=1 Tax=Ornithinimicrobium murale TaxID=1050153 RepID=UPI000E0D6082|nr:excalibur calcium-binding domain-containing protein [Ornithinimicrobium murale]
MRTKTFVGAVLILTVAVTGCQPNSDQAPTADQGGVTVAAQETTDTTEQVETGSAMDALDGLRIIAHDIAPYDREAAFGGSWTDSDGNGCTTRQGVMKRDATEWVDEDGDCQSEQVVIADRYTGTAFVATNVGDAHTEHVVSAHDAWLTGAQNLTQDEREAFYQDPLNLITVEGSVNMSKGDKNAAQWLPPFEGGHCEFAAQQVTVKAKYDLGVTDAEYVALSDILAGCSDQGLITLDDLADTPVFHEATHLTGGNEAEAQDVNPAPSTGTEPFENCTQAREAGAAPLHKGEPGYGGHMDGDGDGVACE